MERRHLRLKPVILASLFAMAGVPGAFAFEAEEVGERLKGLLAKQQIELSYGSARLDGDDVTLAEVSAKSAVGGKSLPLGDLTLQDVSEEEDGTFRVGTFALDEFEHRAGEVTVSLSALAMTGLVLPADAASDPFGGAMRYEHMEVARVDVDGKDGPIGSLVNAYADLTVSDEDDTIEAKGAVEAFSLNLLSLTEGANAAAMLEELGYGQVGGSARMEGSWRPSDGRTTLSRYEATIDDAGTLNLMVDFAGYTPEFISTLEEMSRTMGEQSGGGQNNSAQGMAMLGMMQQLDFHGMMIRFTDDTLTEKMLDYVAKQQGSTAPDIVTQAKAVIPLQLAPFIGQQMADDLAEAVGTFLQNPDNLEINATPEKPVPFAMLMAAAMGSPEMLIQQIGLTVKANE